MNLIPVAKINIIEFAKSGDLDAIRDLDPNDVDIEACDDGFGFTALGWACWYGQVAFANLLLDRFQPDINKFYLSIGNSPLATPLHLACEMHSRCAACQEDGYETRQLQLVERLLTLGADIDHRDTTGNTAYSRALIKEHFLIADLLEAHGAGPQHHGIFHLGLGPIEHALEQADKPETIRQLLKRGAVLLRPTLAARMLDEREQDAREWAKEFNDLHELDEDLARIAEIRAILAEELQRPDLYEEQERLEHERYLRSAARDRLFASLRSCQRQRPSLRKHLLLHPKRHSRRIHR